MRTDIPQYVSFTKWLLTWFKGLPFYCTDWRWNLIRRVIMVNLTSSMVQSETVIWLRCSGWSFGRVDVKQCCCVRTARWINKHTLQVGSQLKPSPFTFSCVWNWVWRITWSYGFWHIRVTCGLKTTFKTTGWVPALEVVKLKQLFCSDMKCFFRPR